jgi:rSAM/selenodomain-associated transferase 1
MDNPCCLIVFARNPVLGKVKTRIGEISGNEKALAIYNELLSHTFDTIAGVNCEKIIFLNDLLSDSGKIFSEHQIQLQNGSNLGERMKNAFNLVFAKGYYRVIILGSDIYELTSDIINEGFQKLKTYDCVIGPSLDGGYYLLGLNHEVAGLFDDVAWGTAQVMDQTIKKLEAINMPFFQLPDLNDVDTIEDVYRYTKLKNIVE